MNAVGLFMYVKNKNTYIKIININMDTVGYK